MADATAQAATITNEVTVEDLGPARKRLTITIPADAVSGKFDESIGTLAGEAALPGFRKGRAPRRLIERRFGESVRNETRNQLIADAYAKAIEAQGLKPLGEPEPDGSMEQLNVQVGKPLTFSVFVEVAPEFALPSVQKLKINKPVVEITAGDVDDELKRQCLRYGTPVEFDGAYREGDRFLCRATATKPGEDQPFFRHDEVLLIHPRDGEAGHVLGVLVEGLAGLLQGKGPGDHVDIQIKGPQSHEREDLRDADIHIDLEIRQVLRIEPASVQTVMGDYGMETEEILREQIRLALEQRRDQDVAAAMRQQVFEHLLGAVDFELPARLSAAQVTRTLEAQRFQMLQRGIPPEEVDERLARIRGESASRALDRLKLMFILHRLADDMKIEVSEQEVNGFIAAVAAPRGLRPEQVRAELVQGGRINEIAAQLREQKTADRIVASADVTEVTVDEWRQLREAGDGKADDAGEAKKKPKTAKKPAAAAESTAPEAAVKTKKKTSTAPAKKSSTKKKA